MAATTRKPTTKRTMTLTAVGALTLLVLASFGGAALYVDEDPGKKAADYARGTAQKATDDSKAAADCMKDYVSQGDDSAAALRKARPLPECATSEVFEDAEHLLDRTERRACDNYDTAQGKAWDSVDDARGLLGPSLLTVGDPVETVEDRVPDCPKRDSVEPIYV